jgi:hypothetical protein
MAVEAVAVGNQAKAGVAKVAQCCPNSGRANLISSRVRVRGVLGTRMASQRDRKDTLQNRRCQLPPLELQLGEEAVRNRRRLRVQGQ